MTSYEARAVNHVVKDIKKYVIDNRDIYFPSSIRVTDTLDTPTDAFIKQWYFSLLRNSNRMIILHKMAFERPKGGSMMYKNNYSFEKYVCYSGLLLINSLENKEGERTMGFMYQNEFYPFDNSEMFGRLCNDILNMGSCRFQPILLHLVTNKFIGDDSVDNRHLNILLIYKISDTYNIFLYEPNGYMYNNGLTEVRDYFRVLLESYTERMGIKAKFFQPQVSCPRGLQKFGGDKYGYCIMFSYFWYYNLISIIRDIHEKKTKYSIGKIIANLEKRMTHEYFPTEMLEAIRKFSIMWIERNYQEKQRTLDKEDSIIDKLRSMFESKEYKEELSFREESREISESSPTRWYQQDGEPCDERHRCASGNCCDGICREYMPYGYECNNDCECISDRCVDGRCLDIE